MSTSLLFLAPLLVTLALKVNSLVGIQQAPSSLALVAGTGALLAMFANPIFGKMSDRTSSPFGMRRPWMVIGLVGGSLGILIVALAPNITILLVGWCMAEWLKTRITHWDRRFRFLGYDLRGRRNPNGTRWLRLSIPPEKERDLKEKIKRSCSYTQVPELDLFLNVNAQVR